jgi:hypothetical protein
MTDSALIPVMSNTPPSVIKPVLHSTFYPIVGGRNCDILMNGGGSQEGGGKWILSMTTFVKKPEGGGEKGAVAQGAARMTKARGMQPIRGDD